MASKRYLFLIGIFCMVVSGASAQVISAYDIRDSSLYKSKDLPQHNEFQNNAYPFPAKPRNQWEFGIKAGLFNVIGDVRSRLFSPGVGLHARKALGYVFSLRGELDLGWAKGLNFSPSQGYIRNPAWNAYNPSTTRIFYNYK